MPDYKKFHFFIHCHFPLDFFFLLSSFNCEWLLICACARPSENAHELCRQITIVSRNQVFFISILFLNCWLICSTLKRVANKMFLVNMKCRFIVCMRSIGRSVARADTLLSNHLMRPFIDLQFVKVLDWMSVHKKWRWLL